MQNLNKAINTHVSTATVNKNAIRFYANNLFLNSLHLINAQTQVSTAMRKHVTTTLQHKFNITVAASASAYNFALKQAMRLQLISKVAKCKHAVNYNMLNYVIVCKQTNNIIALASSKNKAYSLKLNTQVVRKSSTLTN